MNKTIEIEGQRILLEKWEVYPTITKLDYKEDLNKNLELEDMLIKIKSDDHQFDNRVNDIYKSGNIFYIVSPYYEIDNLTLYIEKSGFVLKDKEYPIDIKNKKIVELPNDIKADININDCITINRSALYQENIYNLVTYYYEENSKCVVNLLVWI